MTAPAAKNSAIEQRLKFEQIRMLFSHGKGANLAALINSGVLVGVMWPVQPKNVLLTWFACHFVIVVFRVLVLRAFEKQEAQGKITHRNIKQHPMVWLYGAGLILSTVLWGIAGQIFFISELPLYEAFITFIIGGMVAGACVTLSTYLPAFYMYSSGLLLPLIFSFLWLGNRVSLAMDVLLIIYWVALIIVARNLNRNFITSYKLQLEREALLEQAESATDAKSRFLATISHELRTPINAIVGFSEVALDKTKDKELHKMLGMIASSGKHLLMIVNDILDMAKLEAGKVDLEHIPFGVQELGNEVIEVCSLDASNSPITLESKIDLPEEMTVVGDPLRVKQVLFNLVNNAVKFTEAGGVTLRITAADPLASESADKLRLRFEVEDTGIGISSEARKNLFKKFSQADASITRKHGGTGLGLSICRNLVNLMGGEIGVKSEIGVGSAFWFEIPFDAYGKDKTMKGGGFKPHKGVDALSSALKGKGYHILVAEDNEINRLLVKAMLEKLNIQATLVNDGQACLEALEGAVDSGDHFFDAVFMDIQMPVMDGVEATTKIRTHKDPEIAQIPIIALTGNVMSKDRRSYLAAGMNACLAKPLQTTELVITLSDIFADDFADDA